MQVLIFRVQGYLPEHFTYVPCNCYSVSPESNEDVDQLWKIGCGQEEITLVDDLADPSNTILRFVVVETAFVLASRRILLKKSGALLQALLQQDLFVECCLIF